MPTPTPTTTPNEFMDQAIADRAQVLSANGDFVIRDEAIRLVEHLRTTNLPVFERWADEVIAETIASRLRSTLQRARNQAVRSERASVFADFADAAANGENPSPFDARYSVPGTNTWKQLGSMNRLDLLAISNHRGSLARANGIEAMFFQALAERLPNDTATVADVLDADTILIIHETAAQEAGQ
jgi:hypothetical protein